MTNNKPKKEICRFCSGTGYQVLLSHKKYKCAECDYWKPATPQEGSVPKSWYTDPMAAPVEVKTNVDLNEVKKQHNLIKVMGYDGIYHTVDLDWVRDMDIQYHYDTFHDVRGQSVRVFREAEIQFKYHNGFTFRGKALDPGTANAIHGALRQYREHISRDNN